MMLVNYIMYSMHENSHTYKYLSLYYIRTNVLSVVDEFEYPDNGVVDQFEREPYVVLFSAPSTCE